ncbi:hypothetical protein CA54_22610 [Symmachiella macrocystis]|uniref:Uncharacterized protein n=1 Tax=Symmachiella macrocystis TaxID=2527985 RepID=A0A5C6BQC6_9PLAN|nr:hypothetical protein [Symmachiella macrocystis]TWU13426.1 hypothetical protein CA54_22610 [Symmachiella macrocystis]
MLEELHTIRTAAQLLSIREPELAESLLGACATVWKQMYELNDWPADLEASALQLAKQLSSTEHDVEGTVTAMDHSTAAAMAKAILDFANELETKNGALV